MGLPRAGILCWSVSPTYPMRRATRCGVPSHPHGMIDIPCDLIWHHKRQGVPPPASFLRAFGVLARYQTVARLYSRAHGRRHGEAAHNRYADPPLRHWSTVAMQVASLEKDLEDAMEVDDRQVSQSMSDHDKRVAAKGAGKASIVH